jgi:hypothetical protein
MATIDPIPVTGLAAKINSTPVFTKYWYNGNGLDQFLREGAANFNSRPFHILEIGAFEGAGTLSFLDTACRHPSSTIVSVDPFFTTDTTTPVSLETRSIFLANVATHPDAYKVQVHMTLSREYMITNPHRRFDLIYIDGSHVPADIRCDMLGLAPLVKPGGIMWMDDYRGGDGYEIKNCIDKCAFEIAATRRVTVIHSSYQLGLRLD